jgi:ABC-type lipoprotein release transport system permease subunit
VLGFAWQAFRRQPARVAASVGAVASSVMLVVVAGGVYLGLLDAMVRWPRTLRGDVVVSEAGSGAMLLRSSSRLSPAAARAVRAVPGVGAVHALTGRLVWLEHEGREALVYLVGIAPGDAFGAPLRVVAGRSRPAPHQILVDGVLAHELGVGLGDRLRVGTATLTVAGITAGGNAVLGTFAFVHRGALLLAGLQEPSLLFVEGRGGVAPATLAERVRAAADVDAVPADVFLAKNQALVRQVVLPLIAVLVVVSAAVGGAIVAVTLWTATRERRAEYGLLAAVGLPDAALAAAVLVQGLLAGVIGAALGIAGALALAVGVPLVEPRFVVVVPPWVTLAAAAGALAVALVAAVVPLRALRRLDPALVFRV